MIIVSGFCEYCNRFSEDLQEVNEHNPYCEFQEVRELKVCSQCFYDHYEIDRSEVPDDEE